MWDLLGSQLTLAVRFFIAFVIVLGLIALAAWLVRRFGASRLGSGGRGRQPRLAVIDTATVDNRRRLVLIRRDNVEHLLMIGGPTDVVIEPNIVRAAAPHEIMLEPVPPTIASEPTTPPVRLASEPAPVVPSHSARAPERPAPGASAQPRAAEPITAKTGPSVGDHASGERHEPPHAIRPAPAQAPLSSQSDWNLAAVAHQLEAALRRAPPQDGHPPVSDPLAAPPPPVPASAPPVRPEPSTHAPARNLSPRGEPTFDAEFDSKFDFRPEPGLELRPESLFELRPAPQPSDQRPQGKPEVKPEQSTTSSEIPYDNLEEEMASLLGRPAGKS